MTQHKGKQGTRGVNQIVEENRGTLSFYRNMALGSAMASLLVNLIFFEMTKLTLIMSVLSLMVLGSAYQFMSFMSRPQYSDIGILLSSGNDLNIEGGVGEEVKDLIILTSGTLLLALLSNYFWLLLLLAPFRAMWMLWRSVIQPWITERNSSNPYELDEKKQRKMERKMRRMR